MMCTINIRRLLAAAVLTAALLTACTTEQTDEFSLPPCSDMPIRWSVTGVGAPDVDTRVMIGDDGAIPPGETRRTNPADPDFFTTLPEVCEVPENDPKKEKGFAIGLFGDYSYLDDGGNTVTVYDLYRGARLVYLPDMKVEGKVRSQWATDVGMRYWHPNAKYIFRAYYPQRLYNYTVSTSNAASFAMTYPSRKLQYDLLLGVASVEATPAQMISPVSITLNHALAALRFEFRLNFKDADFLTSVYLLNDEERLFFSQGTVSYGDSKSIHSMKWLQDYNPPADEVLYKWVPPLQYWYGEDTNGDGVIRIGEDEEMSAEAMLEKWGWKDGKPENVPLTLGVEGYNPVLMYSKDKDASSDSGGSSDTGGESGVSKAAKGVQYMYTGKKADAYYGTDYYYDWKTKNWGYCDSKDAAAEGVLFCRNSGWLLIPPQESYGKLTLCFTTKKGGGVIYKVKLPMQTKTKLMPDGTVITESSDGTGGTDPTTGKYVWAAGKRYTYTILLSESNLSVDLSIKDWNERKHSTEIIF